MADFRMDDLKALSQFRGEDRPVFSLYMNSKPGLLTNDPISKRFQRLEEQSAQQAKLESHTPEYQDSWRNDIARINTWLEANSALEGHGLALFCSGNSGLWKTYGFPEAFFDQLVVKDKPYLRPVEIISNEYRRTLVVLLAGTKAWTGELFLKQFQEIQSVDFVPVTGDNQVSLQIDPIESLINQTGQLWHDRDYNRLIVGAPENLLHKFQDSLPRELQEHLAGLIPFGNKNEKLEQAQAEVMDLEDKLNEQLERERVEELIKTLENGGAAVTGLDQSLLAVKSAKVRLLIVEEGYHQHGGQCPNCGFLGEGEEKVCLLCGMALRPEPDIVEAALKRVLDYGGEIEILRSKQFKHALEPFGRIAALVFDSTHTFPEKEQANQMPLTHKGEIRHDALHDEAVQESFPASDPPSF